MTNKTDGFTCANCAEFVSYDAPGTKNRNHCPYCLFSLHVDIIPGDRKNTCKGLMSPVGKVYKKDMEEVIVHKCLNCSEEIKNRIAGDDSFELVENLSVLDSTKYL